MSSQALFGTDGIRGKVNQGAIRPENFVRFGEALAHVLKNSSASKPQVMIGRDTRQSGLMIEAAIISGLLNGGADVVRGGVMPTPAVGYLTRKEGYAAGLMITASHNPPSDNGVKIFGSDGFKLPSELQSRIEELIFSSTALNAPTPNLGDIIERPELATAYLEFARTTVDPALSLKGLKVCIDGANGAGFSGGEELFAALGADVIAVGNTPNGQNINSECGALHPEKLSVLVIETGANIGIAFDGDADRIIVVDEAGEVIDGDQIMGAIGLDFHARGKLAGNTVVATIMSNLGLEGRLKSEGIRLERTAVGDRYVVERMREGGFNVGGEQSGHIVLSDWVTTGDAIISALQLLAMLVRERKPASELLKVFEPVPQLLVNVRYGDRDPLLDAGVKDVISDVEAKLGEDGRLVIRKSGTEPVVRVMAEAFDAAHAEEAVHRVVERIQAFVGS